MTTDNIFTDFQAQVNALTQQAAQGDISEEARDDKLRQMKLSDEQWGDEWMLNAEGTWFRKAKGSKVWLQDYPIALIDPDSLPASIVEMDLRQLAHVIHNCTRCPLSESRNRPVPGEGNPDADIMFIGEGPGFNEDKQARPFVGASGKFLEELLNGIGLQREDVFIANVVKCRPPNNRDPQPAELEACGDYLNRQIELIDPKVIVTLGRFSMYRYFPGASISKIHGQPKTVGKRLIVPMFHPAAALHQPKWRTLVVEDFAKLPNFIKEAQALRQEVDNDDKGINPDNVQQLSMF